MFPAFAWSSLFSRFLSSWGVSLERPAHFHLRRSAITSGYLEAGRFLTAVRLYFCMILFLMNPTVVLPFDSASILAARSFISRNCASEILPGCGAIMTVVRFWGGLTFVLSPAMLMILSAAWWPTFIVVELGARLLGLPVERADWFARRTRFN